MVDQNIIHRKNMLVFQISKSWHGIKSKGAVWLSQTNLRTDYIVMMMMMMNCANFKLKSFLPSHRKHFLNGFSFQISVLIEFSRFDLFQDFFISNHVFSLIFEKLNILHSNGILFFGRKRRYSLVKFQINLFSVNFQYLNFS